MSCAEGFTLDGQDDGPTSFNLTCELRNGVLQWVQNHSACYFIGTELPTYEIDFSAYIDKTVEFAQADLTANFPSLSPQFLVGSTKVQATNSNSNFQHHLTDGLNVSKLPKWKCPHHSFRCCGRVSAM